MQNSEPFSIRIKKTWPGQPEAREAARCCPYERCLPVSEWVSREALEDRIYIIAIDGRAASGKSTMARQLKDLLDADVIRMDDFFLPAALRTPGRLEEPGGNVHYERFEQEVLAYLSLPQRFSYRQFDCGRMDYGGERVIGDKRIRIVEGSYSLHPRFGRYADLAIFSDVEPQEQMRRIGIRDGQEKARMFQERWIPLEEKYFAHCRIRERCDLVI